MKILLRLLQIYNSIVAILLIAIFISQIRIIVDEGGVFSLITSFLIYGLFIGYYLFEAFALIKGEIESKKQNKPFAVRPFAMSSLILNICIAILFFMHILIIVIDHGTLAVTSLFADELLVFILIAIPIIISALLMYLGRKTGCVIDYAKK